MPLQDKLIIDQAPSYFSQYFKCQLEQAEAAGDDPWSSVKTLYIDRDPGTFRDISLHLQGYSIKPRDATHFVRLFADAHFYSRTCTSRGIACRCVIAMRALRLT